MTRLISLRAVDEALNMRALFAGDRPTLEEIYKAQVDSGFGSNGYPQGVKMETLKPQFSEQVTVVTFKLQKRHENKVH
jgi:hypothetical protein